MPRLHTGQFLKALLLGFFCCLGASAKEAPEKKQAPLAFALKQVHQESATLAKAIERGEKVAPPGFKIFQQRITDPKTNKVTGKEPILLTTHNIIGIDFVQLARPSGQLGEVAVSLTKEGGKRLTATTQAMRLGQDRIAIVFEGECLIAPIVQAVLGRQFVITGLDGKAEVARVTKALNPKAKK